jgi:hypothetical protein
MRRRSSDFPRLAAAGVALVFALLAASCAERPVTKAPPSGPPVNLSGYSPAFREGFDDGCRTARGDNRRDEKRYAGDTQYAQGWSDGRSMCAKR